MHPLEASAAASHGARTGSRCACTLKWCTTALMWPQPVAQHAPGALVSLSTWLARGARSVAAKASKRRLVRVRVRVRVRDRVRVRVSQP